MSKRSIGILTSVLCAAVTSVALPLAASAGGRTDPSQYNITCNDATGSITFSPPLRLSGTTSGPEQDKVAVTFSGCTTTKPFGGGPTITVSSGVVSGILHGDTGSSCMGLLDGQSPLGSLSIRWKSPNALTEYLTSLNVNSLTGTSGSGPSSVVIPGPIRPSSVGPFSPSYGVNDQVTLTTQSLAAMTKACGSAGGLATLPIRSGSFTTAPPV